MESVLMRFAGEGKGEKEEEGGWNWEEDTGKAGPWVVGWGKIGGWGCAG